MRRRTDTEAAETVVIIMHAHNIWSRWCGHLEEAASRLGLRFEERTYRNPADGSWTTEYTVPTGLLAARGGLDVLHEIARRLQREAWDEPS